MLPLVGFRCQPYLTLFIRWVDSNRILEHFLAPTAGMCQPLVLYNADKCFHPVRPNKCSLDLS